MRGFSSALALCAVLLPAAAARAEPISADLRSSSGGFVDGTTSTGWFSIDLGEVTMPAGSSATYMIDGLRHGSDYTVSFMVSGMDGWDGLTAEILDPLDSDDALDPVEQPEYVPDGYSTSNTRDGFSFAQGSGMERSAVFAGGSGDLTADEMTNRGDMLMFTGLSGADSMLVTFGLRDRLGERGFLLRLTASAADAAPVPEPASMFLIGSGLAGLAAYRRRRRMVTE